MRNWAKDPIRISSHVSPPPKDTPWLRAPGPPLLFCSRQQGGGPHADLGARLRAFKSWPAIISRIAWERHLASLCLSFPSGTETKMEGLRRLPGDFTELVLAS